MRLREKIINIETTILLADKKSMNLKMINPTSEVERKIINIETTILLADENL